ncbi:MAG: ABC transporter permease [Deltaproteobacteria bacterium]|jgi:ABC-2 type transport system permease protein|nr:ABC transporter permease [Deltaproteobacteria bacterium]
MKAIIRKELADHFSSARFLFIASLIFMISFLGAHLASQGIQEVLASGSNELLAGRTFLLIFTSTGAFFPLTVFLALFGPLVGLVLGFDAINRERAQGTLSKILSQPIYRDEVILGKYFAGLIIVAIMLAALFILLGSLGLIGAGVVPTPEEVLRLFIFWLLCLIYIGFWLGLAIVFSIVFRSVATSALASAAVWILIAFFLPVLGQALAQVITPMTDPQRPAYEELARRDMVNQLVSKVSPTGLFNQSSLVLLDPTHRGSSQAFQTATSSRINQLLLNHFQGGLSLGQSIALMMPEFLILTGFMVATFIVAYLTFVHQEVRSI